MAADLEISVGIDARQTKTGAAEAKSAVKGLGDEVEKTGKKAKSAADRDMKALEQSMLKASTVGTAMGHLIGQAFDQIVRGAVMAVQAIYDVAKGFADAGVEIYKAQQITQLSAETLSAVAMQARRTGISMNEVGESFKEFTKLIGDANNESKDAVAKLARLGVDPVKAANNLEAAYRQVLLRIVSLKNPIDQGNAAMDAFGETGYKLLPFIKSFDGDLDKLIKTARDLGVVMSEQDVKAAREFDKATKDLQETVRGLMMMFGREYLPTLKAVIDNTKLWFTENKAAIQDWAVSSGNALRGFIMTLQDINTWMDSHPRLMRFLFFIGGATMGLASSAYDYLEQKGAGSPLGMQPNYDPSLSKMPDLTRTPSTYFPRSSAASRSAGSSGSAAKPELTAEQKQAQELRRALKDLRKEIKYFGLDSEEAALGQKFFEETIAATNTALANQALQLARDLDKKKADAEATKQAAEATKKYAEMLSNEELSITKGGKADQASATATLAELTQQIALGRELNDVERQQIANQAILTTARAEYFAQGFTNEHIESLIKQLGLEQKTTLEIIRQTQAEKERWAAQQQFKSVMTGLDDEYASLTAELLEYTTGVKATTLAVLELTAAYKQMTPEQQAAAKASAERNDQIKATLTAAREAQQQYDSFKSTILDGLQAMEGGAGSFFSWMYNRFRRFLQEMVAEWLASKFFKMFFGGGNQQAGAAAGGGGGQGGFLVGIGNIFSQIFGGGGRQGGGQGPGGTPLFNGGQFAPGGGSSTGSIVNGQYVVDGGPGMVAPPDFSNMIRTIGLRGGGTAGGGGRFGNNMGTYGAVGGLANIAGGLIGGRVGGVISMAGTGLAMGAQIGMLFGPAGMAIGAAIGAAAGAIAGIAGAIFGRNRARRRDEQTRNQGMLDAFAELKKYDDLIRDVRTLRIDPDSGIAQGTQLGETVRSNYLQMANSLKDRKTRNIALADVSRIDTIITQKMSELRGVADISRAAGERERRIVPEFAGGVYMSPAFQNFRRYNGMLAGQWNGRDTIPAMLAAGEMVINPMQQARVRAAAGRDVFRTAGIPGYADGGMVQGGGSWGDPVTVQVAIQGPDAQGMFQVAATSPKGRKVILDVVGDGFANSELSTKRRA